MRRSVTRGILLATVLGVAAWPATASRYATLLHPMALPDTECGFLGGQEATGAAIAPATVKPLRHPALFPIYRL